MKEMRNFLAFIGILAIIYWAFRVIAEWTDPINRPPPPGSRGDLLSPVATQRDFVHVQIDTLRILKIPVDILELNSNSVQLQLFIFISDGSEIGAKFDYFSGKYRAVHKEEDVLLGKTGAYFDAQLASDIVFVWFLAVDSDELDQPLDFSLNQSTDYALEIFTNRIRSTPNLSDLTNWNLWARVASMVAEAGLGIWQVDDLIGQQVIALKRQENWNAARRRIETDSIRIDYDIIRSDERPVNTIPLEAPMSTPWISTNCPGAPPLRFRADEVVQVDFNHDGALRILRHPETGAEGTIIHAYDNYRLKLLDGPVCGKWNGRSVWYWRVHYKGRDREVWGWAAEGIRGDHWMCPLADPECGS